MKLVSLHNVSVSYEGIPALRDVTLDLFSDDFTGIIGPNGGGKTTLVKAILGMVPYSGRIEFADGISVHDGTIGYLPQQNNFDRQFPISVAEVVYSGLQSRKRLVFRISSDERKKADELMAMAGIAPLSGKPIGAISGGEMQRALLCRALISDPKLLILDEPTNFVDNKFEKELYEILASLNDRMAIVMVSHDLGTITSYVKSIVCVNRTVHRHNTNNITPEQLANYNCPIQLIYQLDRTVVIGQLFGGNIIRVVSVYRAVDANDALDVTCYCPQVMRHHDDSHAVIERGQYFVQFLFKFVIDKIGRFVQNEQFRVGNQCPTE